MEDNEIDQTNICSTIDHDIATKEPAPRLPPQIGSYTRAASLTFTLDFSQRLYRMQDAARAQQSLKLRVSIQQKPERPNCGTRRSAVVALRIVIMSCFSVVFILIMFSQPLTRLAQATQIISAVLGLALRNCENVLVSH